jgi:tRNA pseudouridine55 synthase
MEALGGIILLDKPTGISSARAVDAAKRLLPRGTKIGHAGTLDPFATGLLVLLIGSATKRCEAMMNQPKEYEATVRLGATSETDDPESPAIATPGAVAPERSAIERALGQFIGDIEQTPPAYSAIKLGGRRACDRVRAGQAVELKPRRVKVDAIELLAYEWPDLWLRIACGRGTYIRSIARDLGRALGVGGFLSQLRRTRIGEFDVASAVTMEQLRRDGAAAHLRVVSQ